MHSSFHFDTATDYKTLLDIDRLKAANDRLYKWIKVLKIPHNKFTVFISDLIKNRDKYASKMPAELRNQFIEDYPVMMYPREIENKLVTQFLPMMVSIVKRLKETDPECIDEMHFHGCMAVRNALWKYRTHASNASLFTYVYDGAFLRMRGARHKYKAMKAKKAQSKIHNATDYFNQANENIGIAALADPKNETVFELLDEGIDVEKMFAEANFSQEECELMRMYMQRDTLENDWSRKFRQQRADAEGKIMTRQAIDNRLMIAKYKLWRVMHKIFGLEFRDERMPFVNRYLKVRKKLVI